MCCVRLYFFIFSQFLILLLIFSFAYFLFVLFSYFLIFSFSPRETRVLIAGVDGVLTDNPKFTFSQKGTLSVPTLKVGELGGDVDAKGYQLR